MLATNRQRHVAQRGALLTRLYEFGLSGVHTSARLVAEAGVHEQGTRMRTAISPSAETVGDRTQRLHREHDGRKKPRLLLRYLRARGHAHPRQDVAHTRAISRNTVGCRLRHAVPAGVAPRLPIATPAGTHPRPCARGARPQ